MNAFLDELFVVGRGVAALLAGVLPSRRWDSLPELPIEQLAVISGVGTLVIGFAVGVGGFLRFTWAAAGGGVDATLAIAERQVRNQAPGEITSFTMQGASALSLPAFLFVTLLGLLATYLTVSGLVRAVAAWAEDPVGDPILTGLDARTCRSASS